MGAKLIAELLGREYSDSKLPIKSSKESYIKLELLIKVSQFS